MVSLQELGIIPFPEGEPSSEPEPEVPPEPEMSAEPGHGEHDNPFWEPVPDWEEVYDKLGVWWYVHIYGIAALYLTITLFCVISLSYICYKKSMKKRQMAYFLSLMFLVMFLSVERAVFMFVDAYNIQGELHPAVGYLFMSVALPCLTSAFVMIFYAYYKATRLQVARKGIKLKYIVIIITSHFVISISLDLLAGYNLKPTYLLIACQAVFIIWGYTISILYFYLFGRIYKATVSNRKHLQRMSQCRTESLGGISPSGRANSMVQGVYTISDTDIHGTTVEGGIYNGCNTDGNSILNTPAVSNYTLHTECNSAASDPNVSEQYEKVNANRKSIRISEPNIADCENDVVRKMEEETETHPSADHEVTSAKGISIFRISVSEPNIPDDIASKCHMFASASTVISSRSHLSASHLNQKRPSQIPDAKLGLGAKLILGSAILLFVLASLYLWGIWGVYTKYLRTGSHMDVWPWYWYESVLRIIEIAIGWIITITAVLPLLRLKNKKR